MTRAKTLVLPVPAHDEGHSMRTADLPRGAARLRAAVPTRRRALRRHRSGYGSAGKAVESAGRRRWHTGARAGTLFPPS